MLFQDSWLRRCVFLMDLISNLKSTPACLSLLLIPLGLLLSVKTLHAKEATMEESDNAVTLRVYGSGINSYYICLDRKGNVTSWINEGKKNKYTIKGKLTAKILELASKVASEVPQGDYSDPSLTDKCDLNISFKNTIYVYKIRSKNENDSNQPCPELLKKLVMLVSGLTKW